MGENKHLAGYKKQFVLAEICLKEPDVLEYGNMYYA
mgnify:CR=1 FL=1